MIEGHFEIDERRWREKVRQREMEIRSLKEELANHLGKAVEQDFSEYEAKIAELSEANSGHLRTIEQQAEENKALKDKIKGLNMQLGRLKNK